MGQQHARDHTTSYRFRCLENGHTFEAALDNRGPEALRQATTCPIHHAPAVRHDDSRPATPDAARASGQGLGVLAG